MHNEPVRIAAAASGVVAATAGVLLARPRGWRWLGALGTALAQVALVVAAGEYARARVSGPVTVRDLEARADELVQALILEEARRA